MNLVLRFLLIIGASLAGLNAVAEEPVGSDHSAHHAHDTAVEMDARGRRFYGMRHQVTDEAAEELRERVDQFAPVDTATIQKVMDRMGSNYEWYISDFDLQGELGVLILAHGFRTRGDRIFRDRLQPLAGGNPTALALGMSMMMSDHIQYAVSDLEKAGTKKIVVVPVVSNRYNSLMRQWEYIFGQTAEPAYTAVPLVKSEAQLVMTAPPEDHPLIVGALIDHAREISTNPDEEFLLLVAHGPESAEDNDVVLGLLNRLAGAVNDELEFSGFGVASLQDDAPKDVRAANVAAMRGLVESATAEGKRVLVITNLLGARVVQGELRKDLRDLDYTFNAKGIVEHDNFIRWIEASVEEAAAL